MHTTDNVLFLLHGRSIYYRTTHIYGEGKSVKRERVKYTECSSFTPIANDKGFIDVKREKCVCKAKYLLIRGKRYYF